MTETPNAIFYAVCGKPLFKKGVHQVLRLAPNKELHKWYQKNKIWDTYVSEYGAQILRDSKALELLNKIKIESEKRDVFLVCVCSREEGNHCHRFLLIDLVKELGILENISKKQV
jgi:uncharacterized protein YeaO (DUF488 family)